VLLLCWKPLGCCPLSPGRYPALLIATLPSSQFLPLDFWLDWFLELPLPFGFAGLF
jgi:hypothetical protein